MALVKRSERKSPFSTVGHSEQSTFFHYNKRDTSQIDYFLCNKQSLVTSVAQEQRNPQNTSCHDPVKVKIQVKFKIIQNEDTCQISSVKVNWEKIDKIKYATVLNESLQNLKVKERSTASQVLDEIETSIQAAIGERTQIEKKSRKKQKLISPNVLSLAKKVKPHIGK